jgi:hypothetical protein
MDFAGRLDIMFFRRRGHHLGIGPYGEISTLAFETFEAGGGIVAVVPADPSGQLTFMVSVGAFDRKMRDDTSGPRSPGRCRSGTVAY